MSLRRSPTMNQRDKTKLCLACGELQPPYRFPQRGSWCVMCLRDFYRQNGLDKFGRPLKRSRKSNPEPLPSGHDQLGRAPQPWVPPPESAADLERDEQMARVRRINCRHYEHCLDIACKEDWPSFTCNGCPVRDDFTGDELLFQAGGYAEEIRCSN